MLNNKRVTHLNQQEGAVFALRNSCFLTELLNEFSFHDLSGFVFDFRKNSFPEPIWRGPSMSEDVTLKKN